MQKYKLNDPDIFYPIFALNLTWTCFIFLFYLIKDSSLSIKCSKLLKGSSLFGYLVVILLLVLAFLFGLTLRCYYLTLATPPLNANKVVNAICEKTRLKSARYCERCRIFLFERMHHCKTCDSCSLRKDHHCWILGRCIAIENYRLFIQLAFFELCFFLYGFAILLWLLCRFFINRKKGQAASGKIVWGIFAVSSVLAIFALVFVGILFGGHVKLLCNSETKIESIVPPGQKYSGDFTRIFGRNPFLWLVPMRNESFYAFNSDLGKYTGVFYKGKELAIEGFSFN